MPTSTKTASSQIRFEPDQRPGLPLTTGLGLQYFLLSVGGIVLTPATVVRVANVGESYLTWACFAALLICGVSTILQAVRIGPIGAGHILLMGTSGAFIAASVAALNAGGPGLLATLVAASALFQFALAWRLSLLRRVITPLVAGTVIMLIAVTVMPIVFGMFEPGEGEVHSTGAPLSVIATLGVTAGIALVGRGSWRLWAPILGVIAGCAVSSSYGMYDTARVAAAPWIGMPGLGWPGLEINLGSSFWTLLPVFVLVTVIGAVETIGDSIAIQQVSWRKRRATDFRVVQGSVAADGVGNFLSGLAGTMPNTTYSSSVAIVELTGVASRAIGVCIGCIFIAFAFLPKATAVILAIPEPIVGAYLLVLLAMLFVLGMRIIVQDGVDYRKSIVIGLAFWLGVGFQGQSIFPSFLTGMLGETMANGMTAGGLVAILLTVVLELAKPRARKMKSALSLDALPAVLDFLRRTAKRRRWDSGSQNRLCAAAEESLLSLLPEGTEQSGAAEAKHLIVSARMDDDSAELSFIASAIEDNLEDRLNLLATMPEEVVEREFSLRLLRHYASSVRHQQYHDIDILAVVVKRET